MAGVLAVVETRSYKPFGGAEKATLQILGLLIKEGVNVTVLTGSRANCPRGARCIVHEALRAGSKLDLWIKLLFASRRVWLRKLVESHDTVYIPRISYPLIPMAKACGKRVIVHLHDYQPISFMAAVLHGENTPIGILGDVKRTIRLASMEGRRPIESTLMGIATPPIQLLSRLWITLSDNLIFVSKRQMEIVLSALPELRGRSRVIHNPPPHPPKTPVRKTKNCTLIYVGGDAPLKGLHILIEAVAKNPKAFKGCRLVMTGIKKKLPEGLLSKIRRLGISLESHPWLSDEELSRTYSGSWGLLFPSIWEEPLPYSVLEAIYHLATPIASRVGGVVEMLKSTPAEQFMFTPGSGEELADRVEKLRNLNPQTIIETNLKTLETLQSRFDEAEIAREITSLFKP